MLCNSGCSSQLHLDSHAPGRGNDSCGRGEPGLASDPLAARAYLTSPSDKGVYLQTRHELDVTGVFDVVSIPSPDPALSRRLKRRSAICQLREPSRKCTRQCPLATIVVNSNESAALDGMAGRAPRSRSPPDRASRRQARRAIQSTDRGSLSARAGLAVNACGVVSWRSRQPQQRPARRRSMWDFPS